MYNYAHDTCSACSSPGFVNHAHLYKILMCFVYQTATLNLLHFKTHDLDDSKLRGINYLSGWTNPSLPEPNQPNLLKIQLVKHFYFVRICQLWNALPIIDPLIPSGIISPITLTLWMLISYIIAVPVIAVLHFPINCIIISYNI